MEPAGSGATWTLARRVSIGQCESTRVARSEWNGLPSRDIDGKPGGYGSSATISMGGSHLKRNRKAVRRSLQRMVRRINVATTNHLAQNPTSGNAPRASKSVDTLMSRQRSASAARVASASPAFFAASLPSRRCAGRRSAAANRRMT